MKEEFVKSYRIMNGGTINAGTVPPSVSRRYLYRQKISNEGASAKVIKIAQAHPSPTNSFIDTTVVPANNSKSFGAKPTEDRLLAFDAGGTIQVQMPSTSGTISVTMGFVDT